MTQFDRLRWLLTVLGAVVYLVGYLDQLGELAAILAFFAGKGQNSGR